MQRRALLATLGSATLAGCGWSQYTNNGGRPGGPSGPGDGGDETPGDEDEDESLPTSEGGDEPITAAAEDLLLRMEDLESDEWSETDVQTAGTCNAFERDGSEYSFDLQTCAAVYDDEETGIEEFESALDRNRKLFPEESDVTPRIGHEAAIFTEGKRQNDVGERRVRLVFRDWNATGRLDFTEDTGLQEGGNVPEIEIRDIVEWGVSMHDRWRS